MDKNGEIVPRNTEGEILVRGYCVMKGYWDDQAATKACIDKDGWVHTGDTGMLDEDGYLSIAGRIKDMIIRGGENVYPKEIEEFFLKNKKIENVQVFGFPDDFMGEVIFAWIQLADGEVMDRPEVFNYCNKNIAYYKQPKYVKFVT